MPDDMGVAEFFEASIDEIHAAFQQGACSAASLVEAYLDRIEAYDSALQAIITVNPNAADRAVELDDHFDREGRVGPLHGIPVIVKDNQDTKDLPTSLGSQALADAVPRADATVVARLRTAGAIVLAKANLQELSYGVDTISSLGGETRNPYSLSRRPSGSSGGTAAAVAANLGMVGTGSDTCSSVRSPPAFTSLVGLRPTQGLVSRSGVGPLSDTQDTVGPITRSVADAARMLDVMSGFDPSDPVTALGWRQQPADGYVSHVDANGLDGARIGVLRSCFGLTDPDSASTAAADAVTSVIDSAISVIAGAGATVVDPVSGIDLDFVRSARVVQFEFKRDLNRYLAGRDASVESLNELVASGQLAPRIAERIAETDILDVDVASLQDNTAYLRRLQRQARVRQRIVARMAEHDLDALLYPPSTIPPVERPAHQPFAELHCELAAHSGLPAIVVPAGMTADGLPVGIELLGPPFGEPRLFELAAGFEAATNHRRPPEGFGPLSSDHRTAG